MSALHVRFWLHEAPLRARSWWHRANPWLRAKQLDLERAYWRDLVVNSEGCAPAASYIVNLHVAGSVVSERDLIETIKRGLRDDMNRHGRDSA